MYLASFKTASLSLFLGSKMTFLMATYLRVIKQKTYNYYLKIRQVPELSDDPCQDYKTSFFFFFKY